MPSNIHITSSSGKIQLFNAKCSHSFGAPLAKALSTSDHRFDYAEQTEHLNVLCLHEKSHKKERSGKYIDQHVIHGSMIRPLGGGSHHAGSCRCLCGTTSCYSVLCDATPGVVCVTSPEKVEISK
jgi:hypothetical protein